MRINFLSILSFLTVLGACAPQTTHAEVNSPHCAMVQPPAKLRPPQIAEHVRRLVEANCIEQARIWYLRGLVRSGVENALAPRESAFEGYGILLQDAGAQAVRGADPATISTVLEDAIQWEASAPLEYPANPDAGATGAARANVATFLRDSIKQEQDRRAAVSSVAAQIAGGVTDESRALVVGSARRFLAPLGSVRIECEDMIYFAGRFTHASAASADGRIAAIETCQNYQIVDTQTGAILQSVARNGYSAVSVRASEKSIQVILAPARENATRTRALLFVMSPTEGVRPLNLPLPRAVRAQSLPSTIRSAGSADGNVVVLELSTGRDESSHYVAYNLQNLTMLWEGGDVGDPRSRLMWRVEKHEGDYILISEVRRNRFEVDGGERLNLRTGKQEFVGYATLSVDYVDDDMPICELIETSARGQPYESGRFLVLARDRARIALQDPPRFGISDCTVTANGMQLLVAVPPFIHRFGIVGVER